MGRTKGKAADHEGHRSRLEVKVKNIPGADFTVYVDPAVRPKAHFKTAEATNASDEEYSYSGPLDIVNGKVSVPARALACSAYRGKFWSITLRCDEKNKRPVPTVHYHEQVANGLTKKRPHLSMREFLGYCPKGHPDYPEAPKTKTGNAPESEQADIFLNDIYPLCREIYDILLKPDVAPHPSGLIMITGATDSSKSLITRGLIFLFLEEAAKSARLERRRRPHLLTFEDPIEQYYIHDPEVSAEQVPTATPKSLEELLEAIYIDYTPREKGTDAKSLIQVTQEALRQTPALLFVGEARDKKDWMTLIEFAGSGHLVITTSHANSVIEAMSGVFRETKTETASQRSEISRRILGVINIRSYTCENVRVLLPSVWRRTDKSVSELVADGLASILPVRELKTPEQRVGYYGRSFMAEKLTAPANISEGAKQLTAKKLREVIESIKRKALEWDLKGA